MKEKKNDPSLVLVTVSYSSIRKDVKAGRHLSGGNIDPVLGKSAE